MSPEERNTFVSLLCNLLVNGYVIWRLREMFAAGAFNGPDALQVWAQMTLWVIGAAIVLTILLTIAFNIVFAIATGDHDPSFLKDERDAVFEMRGNGATTLLMVLGFIGSIVALAVGSSALTAFLILYFLTAAGSLMGDIVKLLSYRAGG